MIIHMVDLVASVRISPSVASKCEKSRKKQKAIELKNKQEEQEEKKMEAKRLQDKIERDRILKMTPE